MDRRVLTALVSVVLIAASLSAGAVSASLAAPLVVAASGPSDPCYWFTVRWAEFTPRQQELLGRLGWNRKNWDSASAIDDPPNESESWAELTDEERQINTELGMTEERWDHPPENCNSI